MEDDKEDYIIGSSTYKSGALSSSTLASPPVSAAKEGDTKIAEFLDFFTWLEDELDAYDAIESLGMATSGY